MDILLAIMNVMIRKAVNSGTELAENTRDGMKKLGQIISGKLLAREIIKKSKNNCLLIKAHINPTISRFNWIKSIFVEYYHILNGNGNIEYKAKYKNFSNRILELYNSKNNKTGYIEIKNEEDIKMCSLFTDTKKINILKKYRGSNKIYLSNETSDFKIEYNKLNAYEFKFKGKIIGKLHLTRTIKSKKYMEKYVLEYENKENEILGLLLSIAIDLLNN